MLLAGMTHSSGRGQSELLKRVQHFSPECGATCCRQMPVMTLHAMHGCMCPCGLPVVLLHLTCMCCQVKAHVPAFLEDGAK